MFGAPAGNTVTVTVAGAHNPLGVSHTWYMNVVSPVKPEFGVNVNTPVTGSTAAVPFGDGVKIVTTVFNVPPTLPGPSFPFIGIITGVLIGVTELSFVATGGLVPNVGSTTVIVNNSVGQFGTTVGGTHTGTS